MDDLRAPVVADAATGTALGGATAPCIDEVDVALECCLVLLVDREAGRLLLGVPNALGWRVHFGVAASTLGAAAEAVAAAGVVVAGDLREVGLMLFTFRSTPRRRPRRSGPSRAPAAL